jgi:hypothetical protein
VFTVKEGKKAYTCTARYFFFFWKTIGEHDIWAAWRSCERLQPPIALSYFWALEYAWQKEKRRLIGVAQPSRLWDESIGHLQIRDILKHLRSTSILGICETLATEAIRGTLSSWPV